MAQFLMMFQLNLASSDKQLINSNTKLLLECLYPAARKGERQPTPVLLSCAVRLICSTQLQRSNNSSNLLVLHTSLQRS